MQTILINVKAILRISIILRFSIKFILIKLVGDKSNRQYRLDAIEIVQIDIRFRLQEQIVNFVLQLLILYTSDL
jgi:hypothetical protein